MKCTSLVLAVLATGSFVCTAAEPQWLSLHSENFEILSSLSAKETRAVAQRLELANTVLANAVFTSVPGKPAPYFLPVRVVIFRSRKEYERFRPIESSVAHYARTSGRDYIALSNTGDGVMPSAVHELFHANARRAGWNLPVWLDEGLAEIYSTLRESDGKIYAGASIFARRSTLRNEGISALGDLLTVTSDSIDYQKEDRRRSLYNETWALVHMLAFHPDYRESFADVLKRLRHGGISGTVLEEVYGKPLSAIETDLRDYVRYGKVREVRVDDGTPSNLELPEATVASQFELSLTWLDLRNHDGADEDVLKGFQTLAEQAPQRPEPWEGLGYYAERNQSKAEAERFFLRAIELGSRNPVLLRDYASSHGAENPKSAALALRRYLELRPGEPGALLLLAEIQTQQRRFRESIRTLAGYPKTREQDELRYQRVMAISKSEIDDRDGARAAARRWLELATDIEDADNADRVVKNLDHLDASDRAAREALIETGEQKVEILDAAPLPVIRPSLEGKLVSFDCKREPSTLVLQSETGPLVFLVDLAELTVYGLRTKTLEVTCGPQNRVNVRVQYDPPPAGQKGIAGVARAIHFEPQPQALR